MQGIAETGRGRESFVCDGGKLATNSASGHAAKDAVEEGAPSGQSN
jgi:hypothetical protein